MRVTAAVLALVALTGCVGPSRSDADYKAKAANTAEAVASAVNTARLGVDALRHDRITAAYLTRLLAEAEEDALAAQQSFDSVQPPGAAADAVHDELTDLMDDALDTLRSLRVAVRRGHSGEVVSYGDTLADEAENLQRFGDDV